MKIDFWNELGRFDSRNLYNGVAVVDCVAAVDGITAMDA